MTKRLIDPPSPFAPLEEWRVFLKELKSIPDKNAEVLAYIAEAEKRLGKAD